MEVPEITVSTRPDRDFMLVLPNLTAVKRAVYEIAALMGGTPSEAKRLLEVIEHEALVRYRKWGRGYRRTLENDLKDRIRYFQWYSYMMEKYQYPEWAEQLQFRCSRLSNGQILLSLERPESIGPQLCQRLGVDASPPAEHATIRVVFKPEFGRPDENTIIPLEPVQKILESLFTEPCIRTVDDAPSDYGSDGFTYAWYSGSRELARIISQSCQGEDWKPLNIAIDPDDLSDGERRYKLLFEDALDLRLVRSHVPPCTYAGSYETHQVIESSEPGTLEVEPVDLLCYLITGIDTLCGYALAMEFRADTRDFVRQRANDQKFRALIGKIAEQLHENYIKHVTQPGH